MKVRNYQISFSLQNNLKIMKIYATSNILHRIFNKSLSIFTFSAPKLLTEDAFINTEFNLMFNQNFFFIFDFVLSLFIAI